MKDKEGREKTKGGPEGEGEETTLQAVKKHTHIPRSKTDGNHLYSWGVRRPDYNVQEKETHLWSDGEGRDKRKKENKPTRRRKGETVP